MILSWLAYEPYLTAVLCIHRE